MRREEGGGGDKLLKTQSVGAFPTHPGLWTPVQDARTGRPPLLPLPEDGDRVRHCGSLGVVPG